jgi:hypothetical protein
MRTAWKTVTSDDGDGAGQYTRCYEAVDENDNDLLGKGLAHFAQNMRI